MSKKEIFIDAENVIIKNNKILEIGGKLKNLSWSSNSWVWYF